MPDWLSSSVRVNSSGMATVLLKQNNPSVCWEVQQITINVGPASTAGNVGVFKNGNMVAPTSALTPVVTSSGVASIGQTAAGLPYIYVQAADELEVVVSSATANDQVSVRAQYREIPLTDPLVRGM